MAKFSEVLTIRNGKNQKKVENPSGQYPIYGSGGIMGYADDYICEANSVIIGRKGNINNPIFVETSFWNVDTAFGLCVNPFKLWPKYLYYFCENYDFEQLNTTVTIPSLTKTNLLNIEIPLPPLDEQRKIAAVLDKVSDLIAKRRQQLDKLDMLVKARFVEMFGDPMINPWHYPMVSLGSILTVEPQNGLYKPQTDYVSDGSGTPILRIDGFYNGKVTDFRALKRLRCSPEDVQRYLLNENDIVINRVNSIEYLGKCGLIQGLLEDTVFESNMMRIHVDETRFDAQYISYLLCTEFVYQQILNRAKKAVNQASINQRDVQSFFVYEPPLTKQRDFSAFVSQVNKSKLSIQNSCEKLETLKKALMQQYFG